MNKTHPHFLVLFIFISQFLVSNVYAEATMHFKNNANQNNNIIYIKDGKIRFSDSADHSNEYSIFDSNSNKLMHISPNQKSYIEIDQNTMNQQMNAVKQRMDMMMAQMQEQMKNMPPEQRQMMENMMSQKMNGQMPGMPQAPQRVQVQTGKTDIIAGVKCAIIEIQINKIIQEELCIANENQFAINSTDKQTIKKMIVFFKQLSKKSGSMMGANSMADQYDGVPIRTREYNNAGGLITESTLNSINTKPVSSDIVSVPATYTKKTMY